MQLRSKTATDEMFAMRQRGASFETIGAKWGLKPAAVQMRLSRDYRGLGERIVQRPANDNIPGRKVVMSPRNGGCSTCSGMMPVTLATSAAFEVAA